MAEAKDSENFDEIVEWAYRSLPQNIRELPDFPGIQVVDEPLEDFLKRKNWRPGRELLGHYSGIRRTQQRHDDVRIAPNLIFVFRGPIQRCSKGDLRSAVKELVWHEVAHWLGHSEEEVKELGLATLTLPPKHAAQPANQHVESAKAAEIEQTQLRCVKCYSPDVSCRELDKPLNTGSWLGEPVPVHAKICTCNSCGYEWDDDDNA